MDEITSIEQFRDLFDTGYEIEFVLNNKHCFLEPNQGVSNFSERRTLVGNDNDTIILKSLIILMKFSIIK